MPEQIEPSRLRNRSRKKQDRILNMAIIIVSLLILVVGGFLVFIIKQTPSSSQADSYVPTHQKGETDSTTVGKIASKTKHQKSKNTQTTTEATSVDSTSTDSQSVDSSNQDTQEGGPSGPWKPIGTSQTEPHQTSYSSSSQDWKEMERALAYAIGTNVNNMTTWWLGNGGGPNLSLGQVSIKGKNTIYQVNLKWIKNKGWEPTSVKKISKQDIISK